MKKILSTPLLILFLFARSSNAQVATTNHACDPCSGKTTIFGSTSAPTTITYQNDGTVNISSSVTHGPIRVIKIAAEIVDVERLGEAGCLKCTKDSKEFGNFSSGSLHGHTGLIVNGTNGYGKQIQWEYHNPVPVGNYNYYIAMRFPPLSELSCCKDSIRVCIRWSFTDKDCITCDTMVCNVIVRQYQAPTGPIWTTGGVDPTTGTTTTGTGGYSSVVQKMGEPFISWYKQKSDDLPKKFESQIVSLPKRISDNELKQTPEEFEEGMKLMFYKIRGLRSATTSLWEAIKDNPRNSMCGNGDFENGLLNANEWSGGYGLLSCYASPSNDPILADYVSGLVPTPPSTPPAVNLPIHGAVCPVPVQGVLLTPTDHAGETHQTIVRYDNDPMLGPLLHTTSSSTNNYALRLGNNCVWAGTEYIAKKFVVTGSAIRFTYALVLNGVHMYPPTADMPNNPSFWVKVFDANGLPINNAVYLDEANPTVPLDHLIPSPTDPFFQHIGSDNAQINYRDWTCATIKFDNSLIGQTVTVALVITDCDGGGHWGYGYIDDWCGNCEGSTTGFVNLRPNVDPCIQPGRQVCVDYTLPKIGTLTGSGTMTLNFYQNGSGSPVYSINSSSLTSPGGTYCFTIDPSHLPCTNGQAGYDMVANALFTITPSGGSPITLMPSSPYPVDDYHGIRPGFNNDLVCCSGGSLADHCCINFVKTVTTQVSMVGNATAGYNSVKFVPSFTAGPRPIKQIRISVANFEISSSNQECLICESNTGKYGQMSVPQSLFGGGGKDAIEGMVYPTQPLTQFCFPTPCPGWKTLPSSEVTWGSQSGTGYNLMDGAGDQTTSFTISLPKKSTIGCCDETIKICIKYSFTDIDCRTCDTVICYSIVNRQAPVQAGQGKGISKFPGDSHGTPGGSKRKGVVNNKQTPSEKKAIPPKKNGLNKSE